MSVFRVVSEIGKVVERVRKEQGATQIQLAQMANVGVRFVRDLEDGKPTIQMDKMMKVLDVLGVRLSYEVPGEMKVG